MGRKSVARVKNDKPEIITTGSDNQPRADYDYETGHVVLTTASGRKEVYSWVKAHELAIELNHAAELARAGI